MNKTVLSLSACLVASTIPANARRNNKEVEKTVTTTTTVVRGDTTITTTTVTSTPAEQESQPGKRSFKSRLSLGGYGEAVMTRNFYSDNVNRYSKAEDYKDAKGHNRFDLPHAVIMLGFDFGRGWTFGSEIEFEHGGTESAVEMEAEETGEWEKEIERGGEVFAVHAPLRLLAEDGKDGFLCLVNALALYILYADYERGLLYAVVHVHIHVLAEPL